ncbi:MAG: spermidine synthase, partial [Cyanobacteria bacterium J06621_15]
FPDPDQKVIAKLYSEGFYRRLLTRLTDEGVFVTQASSSFFAPKVISCISATLEEVGLKVNPYTISVPSFGPWGFVLASRQELNSEKLQLPVETRFLTENLLHNLFELPKDMQIGKVEINRLSHPVIVSYQMQARWLNY